MVVVRSGWSARAQTCGALSAALLMSALALPDAVAQEGAPEERTREQARETGEQSGEGLSLEEVLSELESSSESWTITELQIEQSRASRRVALGSLLPQLSASADVTRQGGGAVQVQGSTVREAIEWGVGATASMSLFNAPQVVDYWQADALLEATRAQSAWQRTLL